MSDLPSIGGSADHLSTVAPPRRSGYPSFGSVGNELVAIASWFPHRFGYRFDRGDRSGREDLGQLEGRHDLELGVGARGRIAVGPPVQQPGRVAEAAVLHLLVG